jgi:predicted transposase/invertase (TIGR01784 family)
MIAEQNAEIRKAVDALYETSADDEVRAQYEMRLKAWRDRMSQITGSYKDGMQKGLLEGLQKGWQEGMQKGLQEGRLEVAQNLRAMGFSEDQIRKVIGATRG